MSRPHTWLKPAGLKLPETMTWKLYLGISVGRMPNHLIAGTARWWFSKACAYKNAHIKILWNTFKKKKKYASCKNILNTSTYLAFEIHRCNFLCWYIKRGEHSVLTGTGGWVHELMWQQTRPATSREVLDRMYCFLHILKPVHLNTGILDIIVPGFTWPKWSSLCCSTISSKQLWWPCFVQSHSFCVR